MGDIPLRNIESTDPLMRSINKKSDLDGIYVDTDYGPVYVIRIGVEAKPGKPFIVTYHDIGLNFSSNYQAFFNFFEMQLLLETFCVLNIHAPGQEDNATRLPDNYVFPTMDQLAQQVDNVCKYFGVTRFVGFGVGAGANVLSRYAMMCPEVVDGLFLIHSTSTQASWSEWFYQKINIYYLSSTMQSFSQGMQDYLLWHHFGSITEDRNRDLIEVYKNYFNGSNHNARNLALFLDSYIRRTDLNIERGNKEKNLQCTVLLLCGSLSPHVDDTVTMNSRLNPENGTWMKLSNCAMILEEQPHKVAEAFRLFLQGIHYTFPAYSAYERRRSKGISIDQGEQECDKNGCPIKVNIVENPIAQC